MTTDAGGTRARAVALAYNDGDFAPRVVAKGSGLIADEIIRRAREAGVFVHESAELVGLLAKVDLDQHIPPQLYIAIAEILAWIYRLEQDAAGATTAQGAATQIAADRHLPSTEPPWNRPKTSSTT